MKIDLTPAQLAEFDQAFAASTHLLTELAASYVVRRRADEIDEWPEQLTIMAMAEFLANEWDTAQLVSALAAAVVVLSTAADGTDQKCEAPCEACAPTEDA